MPDYRDHVDGVFAEIGHVAALRGALATLLHVTSPDSSAHAVFVDAASDLQQVYADEDRIFASSFAAARLVNDTRVPPVSHDDALQAFCENLVWLDRTSEPESARHKTYATIAGNCLTEYTAKQPDTVKPLAMILNRRG